MTTQDIIKQTESLTIEEKQQLAYYLLFSTIDEDKRQEFMRLFHYKNKITTEKNSDDIYNSIDDICGSGKGLWKEDAQVYINKLREDDRQF